MNWDNDDDNPFEQDMSETLGTEWPKWVWPEGPGKDKPTRLCNTPAEEAEYLAEHRAPTRANLEFANDFMKERAALIAQAEAKGVTVDKRWGIERLKAALA